MLHNDLIGLGLYIGYIIAIGLPAVLLKVYFNVPFEVVRKMYHLVITLSIFPLMKLFSTWYMAVLAASMLALIAYPLLILVENSSLYKRIAVEREDGEFKRSLLIVQVSIALMIFVFWGLLGAEWQYVAVVAVMAWGWATPRPHWSARILGDAGFCIRGSKERRQWREPRRCSSRPGWQFSLRS